MKRCQDCGERVNLIGSARRCIPCRDRWGHTRAVSRIKGKLEYLRFEITRARAAFLAAKRASLKAEDSLIALLARKDAAQVELEELGS